MLLKIWFLLSCLFSNVESEVIYLNLQTEMLLEFKNAMNIEIVGFYLIHLGFVLDSSYIFQIEIC